MKIKHLWWRLTGPIRYFVWKHLTEDGRIKSVWPSDLVKAAEDDSFEYLIVLSDGTRINCEGVKIINKDWIHISPTKIRNEPCNHKLGTGPFGYRCERGITIAVRQIVAVLDAPSGS